MLGAIVITVRIIRSLTENATSSPFLGSVIWTLMFGTSRGRIFLPISVVPWEEPSGKLFCWENIFDENTKKANRTEKNLLENFLVSFLLTFITAVHLVSLALNRVVHPFLRVAENSAFAFSRLRHKNFKDIGEGFRFLHILMLISVKIHRVY